MTKKERIMDKLVELLDEYDYEYSDFALEKIIDEWNEKKESLRNILRKHPRWNEEEDMIVFDLNLKREIDKTAVMNFMNWAMEVLGLGLGYIHDENSIWKSYNFPREQFVTQEMIDKVRVTYPDFKASVGQKTSRAMNRLFCELKLNESPEYNREFAKYADALNPLTITRHTVISVNLIDYLTMSFGNSWASCHTIDKTNKRGMPNNYSGCYSSGTLSYALDTSSMVFYTVDSKYNGNEYYFEPKINRQMFHFGNDKLVQGRLYPQSCDSGAMDEYTQFRNIVQEIVAIGLGVPNLWTLKRGASECGRWIQSYGTHYRDYNQFNNCTISILKDSKNEFGIQVGAKPICIECGARHHVEDNINCCSKGYICEDCGRRIDEDDVYWVDGNPYCCNCASYCDECGEYYINDDGRWVESANRWVCDHCLDRYYRYCEYCEEYHHEDYVRYVDSVDEDVCDSCLEEHFVYCNRCEEYVLRDNATYNNADGYYYCDDCYEEIQKDEEEDEDESEAV